MTVCPLKTPKSLQTDKNRPTALTKTRVSYIIKIVSHVTTYSYSYLCLRKFEVSTVTINCTKLLLLLLLELRSLVSVIAGLRTEDLPIGAWRLRPIQ